MWRSLLSVITTFILVSCESYNNAELKPTNTAAMETITVYFLDETRYQTGIEPYETPIERTIPAPTSPPNAVLTQLFLGPSESQSTQGLRVVLSGTTGYSNLSIENGIARVYLTGSCSSGGATYTIANLIQVNLKQFPDIQWVKIFDQNNQTESPEGSSDSIPLCLEP